LVRGKQYRYKGVKVRAKIARIIHSPFYIIDVLRGAFFLFMGVGLYTICNFIFQYFLIHTWTPAEYGMFSLTITIVGLIGICTEFNLNVTTTIILSKDVQNPKNKMILENIFIAFAILVLLNIIVTFSLSYFYNSYYPVLNVLNQYFILIWILVITTGLTAINQGFLRAHKLMSYEAISNAGKGLFILALAAITICFFPNILSLSHCLYILIISQTLSLLLTILFSARTNFLDTVSGQVFNDSFAEKRLPNLHYIYKFSFFMSVLSISTALLVSTDRLLIPYFLSDSMLGLYAGAAMIAGIPKMVAATVATSLIPFISERNNNITEAKREYLGFFSIYNIIALAGYGLFVCLTPYLISLMLPETYSQIAMITRILLLSGFFADIYRLNTTFAASIGMTNILMKMNWVLIAAVVMNVGLNLILIPLHGIDGAAMANIASFIFAGIISTVQILNIKDV